MSTAPYARPEPAARVHSMEWCTTCRDRPDWFCYCNACMAMLGVVRVDQREALADRLNSRNAAIAAAPTHRERRGWFFLGLAIGSIPALGIWFVTWLANH